uniref:uncharacterized protein LOC122603503 isoform X2 n=1 Tax=Erigeron canadensis TaxID=72917 RepID=UPI001CB8D60D|nr:uncharacterized protein LOC122603503 isoform X2 [Erigeron canadensis]
MAGNTKLESVSAASSEPAFSGAYTNGKRGSLDRTGSFREGGESRGFGVTRGGGGSNGNLGPGSLHSLSQCLSLEPIPVGDRKTDRLAEVRRVMGLFVGSSGDESSSGVGVSGNAKPSTPVAVGEDLKRLRSSFVDTCNTARGRASKLDEHLNKLDKYCDGVMSKKPQRNELTNSDQEGVLNSKIGTQILRNPTEVVNQRVEDRPKNVLLNKRVRTSVAETRAELRVNSLRRQPIAMAKDRDLLKDSAGESDIVEEKIHRLPAVGEGWDKKIKRKRSVGAVFTRPIDSNGDVKRTAQNKVVSEPGLLSKDAQPCRLGSSNSGSTQKVDNKLEGPNMPHNSRARMSPSDELEGPAKELSAGSNKEKNLTKGNTKSNARDDNTACGNLVTKGKASRTSRNGPMVAASSSPSNPHLSGTPEICENVTSGSKIPSIGGTNNRKRAVPPGSSSPPMAQWVGQRPQKISRNRRANLVSPVLKQEEKPLSPDSCSQPDISVRVPSDAKNGLLVSKQFKLKLEPVQSPLWLTESEKSIGGQNVGPSLATAMKVKAVTSEENDEGVKRQGHNGRGPLIVMASSSTTGEKLDNVTMVKPVRSNRPGCEKNGSKAGRPLKKLSDRKGFPRPGHLQNNGSDSTTPTGNDDREELLASASHARNASYLACSSTFWKKLEPIFAPVSSRDKLYLSQQLKEHGIQESFHQLPGRENNIMMNHRAETSVYNTNMCGERSGHVKHQGSESFSGRLDSDKRSKEFIPLIQRVLSALIIEDTIDELEEDTANILLEDSFCDSVYNTFQIDGYDSRKRSRREAEDQTMFQSVQSVKVSFSSNRKPSIDDSPCEDVMLAGISKNVINRPQIVQMEGFGISSFDNQYEHMCLDEKLLLELHSIGLYPELVPKLDNKDNEAIKHEIDQLKTRLQQQNYKKKACLEKICEGVGRSSLGRNLEQLALDRLVELAYRKLLATRGPSRGGIPKIPKHVALAFGRRTLAKCRKFGKSGVSCFNVPPLRDILYAPHENELEHPVSTNTTTRYIEFQNPHLDSWISSDEAFVINGPMSNPGKKKELLLDDVGTVFGGTMGKRAYPGDKKTNLKQKAGQPPTPRNGYGNQSTRSLHPVQPSLNGLHHNGDDTRKDIQTISHSNGLQEMSKESSETIDLLHDLDPIDELAVDTELGDPQDLGSLLNFDEEDLQDHYSAGLEIPMDDLTELNMF